MMTLDGMKLAGRELLEPSYSVKSKETQLTDGQNGRRDGERLV